MQRLQYWLLLLLRTLCQRKIQKIIKKKKRTHTSTHILMYTHVKCLDTALRRNAPSFNTTTKNEIESETLAIYKAYFYMSISEWLSNILKFLRFHWYLC